jgi:hypothetical protein
VIEINNANPLQATPGTAWISHLFEHPVVVGARMVAFIADIDPDLSVLWVKPGFVRLSA